MSDIVRCQLRNRVWTPAGEAAGKTNAASTSAARALVKASVSNTHPPPGSRVWVRPDNTSVRRRGEIPGRGGGGGDGGGDAVGLPLLRGDGRHEAGDKTAGAQNVIGDHG